MLAEVSANELHANYILGAPQTLTWLEMPYLSQEGSGMKVNVTRDIHGNMILVLHFP